MARLFDISQDFEVLFDRFDEINEYEFPLNEKGEPVDDEGNAVAVCPECGYEFPKKERSEIQQEQAELKKIEGFVLDYKTPEECNSVAELREYAASHGYKPGWAYYQAKRRGLIA